MNIIDIAKPILLAIALYASVSTLMIASDKEPKVDHVVPDEYGLVIRATDF